MAALYRLRRACRVHLICLCRLSRSRLRSRGTLFGLASIATLALLPWLSAISWGEDCSPWYPRSIHKGRLSITDLASGSTYAEACPSGSLPDGSGCTRTYLSGRRAGFRFGDNLKGRRHHADRTSGWRCSAPPVKRALIAAPRGIDRTVFARLSPATGSIGTKISWIAPSPQR